MQNSSPVIESLASLIPVAVGAVIALGGGTLKYWIDRADRRKQTKREKLDRLLTLVFELKDWTGRVDDRYTFGTTSVAVVSPLEEMEVIMTLHFPELRQDIATVAVAALAYKTNAINLGQQRMAANGAVATDVAARAAAPYPALANSINEFANKARDIAKSIS